MKKSLLPLLTLVMLLAGAGIAYGQNSDAKLSKKERRAAELDKVVSLIESGNYVYTIQSINPTGARTLQATSLYTMKAVNGNYEASLPYFGRSYQASYGGDGPIEFNGAPENLEIKRNDKKNTVTVTFSIKGEKDLYRVTFSVGYSGYGTLTVLPQNRQTISYYGVVSEKGR